MAFAVTESGGVEVALSYRFRQRRHRQQDQPARRLCGHCGLLTRGALRGGLLLCSALRGSFSLVLGALRQLSLVLGAPRRPSLGAWRSAAAFSCASGVPRRPPLALGAPRRPSLALGAPQRPTLLRLALRGGPTLALGAPRRPSLALRVPQPSFASATRPATSTSSVMDPAGSVQYC